MVETVEIGQDKGVEFLRKRAEDPFLFIRRKLNEGVKVIAIGNHHPSRPQQEFYLELLDRVEKIDFLAVEIENEYKNHVERWLETREIDEKVKKAILGAGNKIFDIVKKASNRGIKIIYADTKHGERNPFMAKSITSFLEDNPGARGLFFAGNLHVSMYQSKVASEAGRLLRSEIGDSFYTIHQADYEDAKLSDKPPEYDHYAGTLLLETVRRLNPKKSLAIPDLAMSPFAKMQRYKMGPISEQYDAVIVHPCGKRDSLSSRG